MSSIIKGSMAAVAASNNMSLAESFMDVDAVIVVDTSGSMDQMDSVGGRSRYEQACKELEALQGSLPGKIAVLSFSSTVMFCPSGRPTNLEGGTDIAGALQFAKAIDVPGITFILISDGQPDDEMAAMNVAKTYKNKISTIYVGPESRPTGRKFLKRLAAVTGGQAMTSDRVKELATDIKHLLTAA